jgi:hypothetical protein
MKKYIITSPLLAVTILAISCSNDEEKDLVEGVNKAGSIETAVSVKHIDSTHDLLTTKHVVWANGTNTKTIESNDTIPALGFTKTEAEDENGDAKTATVKKAYEIYITVK